MVCDDDNVSANVNVDDDNNGDDYSIFWTI
jgi:hypothetical protein